MPSLNEHISAYTATYDSFTHKCMSDEKAKLWHRHLLDFPTAAVDKAFDELFSSQKYAFQLVDIKNCIMKYRDQFKIKRVNTDDLPPPNNQNIVDLNQMIKLDAAYRSGSVSWDEFEAVALPFAGKISEEDEKVGQAVMERFEMLKAMKVAKPEKQIEPVVVMLDTINPTRRPPEETVVVEIAPDQQKSTDEALMKPEDGLSDDQEPQDDDEDLEW